MNFIDEIWFQKHKAECKEAEIYGQPWPQSKLKHQGSNKHKFNVLFELYCANFIASFILLLL